MKKPLTSTLLERSFLMVQGLGESRQKQLRDKGIYTWKEFPQTGLVLTDVLDARVRIELSEMQTAVQEGNLERIVQNLSSADKWRLFDHYQDTCCYVDIETTMEHTVTTIGVYDPVRGSRVYVRGLNLGDFTRDPLGDAVATFNGSSFDLPILSRTFPSWKAPPLHFDLRPIMAQLGHKGGLKAIEERLGFSRPAHLQGMGGLDAITHWNQFVSYRSIKAMRKLIEYNLWDVIQLRSLLNFACNALAEKDGIQWNPNTSFHREDCRPNIESVIESILNRSDQIDPEQRCDEERRTGLI